MPFLKNKSVLLKKLDLVLILPKEEQFQKLDLFLHMKNHRFHAFIVNTQDTLIVSVMLCKNLVLLTMYGFQEGL